MKTDQFEKCDDVGCDSCIELLTNPFGQCSKGINFSTYITKHMYKECPYIGFNNNSMVSNEFLDYIFLKKEDCNNNSKNKKITYALHVLFVEIDMRNGTSYNWIYDNISINTNLINFFTNRIINNIDIYNQTKNNKEECQNVKKNVIVIMDIKNGSYPEITKAFESIIIDIKKELNKHGQLSCVDDICYRPYAFLTNNISLDCPDRRR